MKVKDNCWCNKQASEEILELESFLKIIADKNRLRIVCFLDKKGETCVCDIFKNLELSQNLTSHHLKKLRDAFLLDERKEGVFVFYSINRREFKKQEDLLRKIILNKK
ncbi:winged helix-turn-helix transcriptional regulator [bacterium]|jgi:DNA-binding transcriptional ArsR family regulator|nr:winged helix-turn-helix transcriptional regulator [bacterium]MBT4250780.1 winged helix-turn-helix transcriptional regulator [bacterium]MBT4598224.1 winged helix-turn-helix transcriptional regulator [bacterium]MBT6753822.1 winged helix-turn-helix transcriptional regulator [bacterium]MBT7037465.1 winged helix-turn-helix transcriptional regulator [bacterium]